MQVVLVAGVVEVAKCREKITANERSTLPDYYNISRASCGLNLTKLDWMGVGRGATGHIFPTLNYHNLNKACKTQSLAVHLGIGMN